MMTDTEVKPQSKMQRAKALYNEIFARGYDCEGKSQRAVFISRAIAELDMTKNGANTYFQNLSNQARGQNLYKYNKSRSARTVSPADYAAPAVAEVEAPLPPTREDVTRAEEQVAEAVDMSHRWQVIGAGGEVIATFPSREKAKAEAARLGTKWKDGNKAA